MEISSHNFNFANIFSFILAFYPLYEIIIHFYFPKPTGASHFSKANRTPVNADINYISLDQRPPPLIPIQMTFQSGFGRSKTRLELDSVDPEAQIANGENRKPTALREKGSCLAANWVLEGI